MPDRVIKYAAIPLNGRLYQGEVVSGLIHVRQSLHTIGEAEPPRLEEIVHPFSIVMTQDCDLESDFRSRTQQDKAVTGIVNILFCEAITTTELKGKLPQGKDIWKRVIQNKDERYHCLESVPIVDDFSAEGVPCLGCDFKRYFTVSADEVYRRIELGQMNRRCRLITPYAEHFLIRFCNFQARVPLPENHDVPL